MKISRCASAALFALALTSPCLAAPAGSSSSPTLQPANNLSDVASPVASCKNTGVAGLCYNIRSFGGYADTWRGAASISATTSGAYVAIDSAQTLDNITITSAGGTSATISPAWLAPVIAGMTGNSVYLNMPGVGTAGGTIHGHITASNPATGVITTDSSVQFAAQTNTLASATVYSIGQNNDASLNGLDYGAVTTTTLTDSTGAPYATQIVIPDAMLPDSVNPTVQSGNKVCVVSQGQNEWCGISMYDGSTTGNTMVVTGAYGYSTVMPYTLSGGQAAVYWGPFLFRGGANIQVGSAALDDSTACAGSGRSIEVPLAGTGTNPNGGVLNSLETTVTTVTSPFSATMAHAAYQTVAGAVGTGSTRYGGTPGKLTVGCNDWPAYQTAVAHILNQEHGQELPYRLYFPGDSFMATATGANSPYTEVTQCGEGTVFWPYNTYAMYHGAASCGNIRRISSFPTTHDLVPGNSLVHLQQVNAACLAGTGRCYATIAVAGNSPLEPGTNAAGWINARYSKLVEIFQRDYPALNIILADRTIGGTQMPMLDPYGYTNGFPNNDVTPASTGDGENWWYGTPTNTWMSYVQATNPDVLMIGFSDQESISAHFSAILDIMSYTQSSLWKSAVGAATGTTGWNPDIGFIPYPYQPTGFYSQQGTNFAAAMQRSFVKACTMTTPNHVGNTMMATQSNGVAGCPFLIDLNRMQSIVTDGYDPETNPMRRTLDLPSYQGANVVNFPWVINTPLPGRSMPISLRYSSTTPSAGAIFSEAGNEIDFTIGASGTSEANTLGFTAHLTAAPSSPYTSLQFGDIGCALQVGDVITYGSSNWTINAVGTCGPSDTVTINAAASTLGTGSTLTITPPGPTTTYPGNILRVYKDTSSAIPISAMIWSNSTGSGLVTVATSYAASLAAGPANASAGSYAPGSQVTIAGASPSAYNGTWTVVSNPTASTFTFALASNPGAATTLGTISGTGAIAYAFDTVYFATTGANCSAAANAASITCTTAEVGSWHQGLQIAIPGGGTQLCPNPGGGATCSIQTIGTVAYNSSGNNIISFANGGTIPTAVTNVSPIIYRRSIPYTVSSRNAETFGANGVAVGTSCTLGAGSYINIVFMLDYRGSRADLGYCDLTGPGPSMVFNGYVERLDAPFQFALDSPTHMGGTAGVFLNAGQSFLPQMAGLVGHTGAGTFGQFFESDPEYPVAEPTARVAPDIYSFCGNTGGAIGFGSQYSSPWGGNCAAHQGQMGAQMLDDSIYALMRTNN